MKSLAALLIVMSLSLWACLPQTRTQQPPVLSTPTHIQVDLTPAQRAAITSLAASLSIPAEQISLVSTEAVTWPNGCLGVQKLGVMCTQNQVPGFRIVLNANGKEYELHTNQDGSIVVPVGAVQVPGAAEAAVIKQSASNLSISEGDVSIISSRAVEWPDSCLGVAMEGVMCAQMITPGYLIVLGAGGRQYEYHTNQDASRIMPASLAMDWKQGGGIAGVCESLTIYLSGEVFGMDCRAGGDGRAAVLTQVQREQLYAWLDEFEMITIDLSDPKGMADGMSRHADLFGQANQLANDEQKRAIYEFGQTVYHGMYP